MATDKKFPIILFYPHCCLIYRRSFLKIRCFPSFAAQSSEESPPLSSSAASSAPLSSSSKARCSAPFFLAEENQSGDNQRRRHNAAENPRVNAAEQVKLGQQASASHQAPINKKIPPANTKTWFSFLSFQISSKPIRNHIPA